MTGKLVAVRAMTHSAKNPQRAQTKGRVKRARAYSPPQPTSRRMMVGRICGRKDGLGDIEWIILGGEGKDEG